MLNVTIIDDSADDRDLAIRALKQTFPEVAIDASINTQELFQEALACGGFDAVVTDYELKWGTGLEVLEAVRRLYPDVPVIMFTNTGSEEIAIAAFNAGLDDYVVKKHGHYARLGNAVRTAIGR